MNIITHDKAYSFYPRATFDEHRSLVCRPDVETETLKKYKDRGWAMSGLSDMPELDHPIYSTFPFGRRYVGDPCCWKIPVTPGLDLPRGFVESNSWVIEIRCDFGEEKIVTKFDVLATRKLKFSYVVDVSDYRLVNAIAKFVGSGQLAAVAQVVR